MLEFMIHHFSLPSLPLVTIPVVSLIILSQTLELISLSLHYAFLCTCSSAAKFDSGTGWPSFNAAIETTPGVGQSFQLSVVETSDHSHGMTRVEVLCRQVRFLF